MPITTSPCFLKYYKVYVHDSLSLMIYDKNYILLKNKMNTIIIKYDTYNCIYYNVMHICIY